MARRVSLPAADDLFRPTAPSTSESDDAPASPVSAVPDPAPEPEQAPARTTRTGRSSGRVRHDEKMTVYVTSDELLDLEHARLSLRREHGLAVDRGRLVREAIAVVLADFETHGDDSVIVRRLSDG